MAHPLFVYKIIKEPPQAWEVEVRVPALWRGVFRSQDGIAWWSPVLDRPLGEHNENPGEARVLANLQAAVRDHVGCKRLAVVEAARAVVQQHEITSGAAWPSVENLRTAIEALDGSHARSMSPSAPLYVGDGHPAVRAAGYEPEPEGAEEL